MKTGKGALATAYLDGVTRRLASIGKKGAPGIVEAASWCAEALAGDHFVWVFGAGHSSMMAMEAYPRIGGVQGFMPMIEPGLLLFTNVVGSMGLEQTLVLERVEGYGRAIHNSYATEKGDVLIIFSSSGLEALPLEIATVARERGIRTVAVSSDEYSREAAKQRGKKVRLAEIADLFIDNAVPAGDASVDLAKSGAKVSPVGSILNLAIMNCIAAETAGALLARGIKPRLFRSPHLGGTAANEFSALLADYRRMIGQRWLRQTKTRKARRHAT
ncbi:MAG TPA: sugar isomerase domain-containing protein [Bauldia sp.]|nr:sugar isomerase domain-containing protein [Bauldia sp.]